MKLALLIVVAVYMVARGSSMSTCKTLDLEMVKKKRIEAIRSQILSKLRLSKEPEEDPEEDDEEIPSTLMSLYNSTKEMLREQQTQVQTDISTEQEEEEYFAKVLHKFNMTKKNYTETTKNSKSVSLSFNISEIQGSVGNYRLLTTAELRILIKQPTILKEQRVELYRGVGPSARYLASRFITNQWKDKWLSFDVTETLQDWLQHKQEEQGFELRLFCECSQRSADATFSFYISGIDNDRSDIGIIKQMTQQPPFILTMSIPQSASGQLSSRKRRSTDTRDTCSAQTETCCVRSLYIDFRKDLGWKWIHRPTGYHANYCMGSCTYIWNAENKYSQGYLSGPEGLPERGWYFPETQKPSDGILALYKHHNPGASAQPCCVPQALEPLPILYYVGRQHKVEQLSNMIVKSCKCS